MLPSTQMNQSAAAALPVCQDAVPAAAHLSKLTVQQLASLSAAELLRLQREAEADLRTAKSVVAWLEAALGLRYKERARQARAEADKDAGTVRFEDNGVTVVADLPKKVEWDHAKLNDITRRITANGEDPAEYVEISYRISETKFNAWPETLKSAFAPARTLKTGKPGFHLALIQE